METLGLRLWLLITCYTLYYVTILWFKLNSNNEYKMRRASFSTIALCIFIAFMLFFLLCNQISLTELARAKSSVLCSFDLLFIKMLWVQINLLCKYLWLFHLTWKGSCRHFDKWIERLSGFSIPSGITFIPYWNDILQFSASVSLGKPQLIFLWILLLQQ